MNTIHVASGAESDSVEMVDRKKEVRLQDLIPIVMVIVGGCESCAEKMVARALNEGCAWQEIDRTLRIVGGMQKMDCFANAVGPEVLDRMDKPLAAGWRTLKMAISPGGPTACGCGGA